MTLIMAAWLRERKACRRQVADFEREWPEGAELTKENLLRAAALSLDLDWFAGGILPEPAQSAYDEATARADRAYDEATSAAVRIFHDAQARALWRIILEVGDA